MLEHTRMPFELCMVAAYALRLTSVANKAVMLQS